VSAGEILFQWKIPRENLLNMCSRSSYREAEEGGNHCKRMNEARLFWRKK